MPAGSKILSIRAGKMNISGTTVTADPTKGLIELYRDHDQLMYFVWRNRSNNAVSPNDELVVVPGEYTWKRVHQCKSVDRFVFLPGLSLCVAALVASFFCLATVKRGSFGCKNQIPTRILSMPCTVGYHCCLTVFQILCQFSARDWGCLI
jgi:hypothetical protein